MYIYVYLCSEMVNYKITTNNNNRVPVAAGRANKSGSCNQRRHTQGGGKKETLDLNVLGKGCNIIRLCSERFRACTFPWAWRHKAALRSGIDIDCLTSCLFWIVWMLFPGWARYWRSLSIIWA